MKKSPVTFSSNKWLQVAPPAVPSKVLQQRRRSLKAWLKDKKVDGYLVTGQTDLHYLTGFSSEGYYGLFSQKGNWLVTSPLLAGQIKESAQGGRVVSTKRFVPAIQELCSKHRLKKVGFDGSQVTAGLGGLLQKQGLSSQPNPLGPLRIVKGKEEIACMRRAGTLAAAAIKYIKPRLRTGVTEKQLAAEIESFFYRNGAEGVSFDLIVAFGDHAALPHHVPGSRRLSPNRAVLFDIGCTVGGYCSDLTRTLFYGKISPLFRRIYGIVESAQKAGKERVRPGSTGGQVDAAARRFISKAGYGRYFIHGTGHGVGLDIHEPPWVRDQGQDRLEAEMVVTVEPGIYLPGKFGVRIEDTLRVTPDGHEVLTHHDG